MSATDEERPVERAPTTMAALRGSIHSIVYQPLARSPVLDVGAYVRVAAERVHLRMDHGIEGDRKAGRSRKRQVNFLLLEWLLERSVQGYRVEPGAFGEQLVISGLRGDGIGAGTRLQLGSSAMLEVTMPRTGCGRLQLAQKRDDPLLLGSIGYLARVTASGVIGIGDAVTLLCASDAPR